MKATIREIERTRDGVKFSIRLQGKLPDRTSHRERYTMVFENKTAANDWTRLRLAKLRSGEAQPNTRDKQIPTLEQFYDREFKDRHFDTGGRGGEPLKPSQRESIESHWRVHLLGAFGGTKIDAFTDEAIDRFVAELRVDRTGDEPTPRKPKTVKNVMTTLATIFARIRTWRKIETPKIKISKVEREEVEFWSFEECDRLVAEARRRGPQHLMTVLLGSRAGLRAGEILSLRWDDVDLERNIIAVRKATWREHEGTPKSHKRRYVPMHPELAAALKEHPRVGFRIVRAPRIDRASIETLRSYIHACEIGAELKTRTDKEKGQVHKLRHTFGAHLAMRGVSLLAIQALMGHANYSTTLVYAHLSPNILHDAVLTLGQQAAIDPKLLATGRE